MSKAIIAKKLNLSEEDEEKLVKNLTRDFEEAETDRKAREPDWREGINFYNLKPKPRLSTFNVANVMVPIVRSHCDAVRARIYRACLGVSPIMTIEAPEVNDEDRCKKNEQYLEYQLQIQTPYKRAFKAVIKDALQVGTGILYLPWVKEIEKLGDAEWFDDPDEFIAKYPELDKFLETYPGCEKEYFGYLDDLAKGEAIQIETIKGVTTYDAPKHERISPFMFFCSPDALNVNDANLVGHKLKPMTWNEVQLREAVGDWENTSKLSEKINEDKLLDHKFENIIQCIYRWDIDGDGYAEKCRIVFDMDSKTILKGKIYDLWHNRACYIPYYINPDENSIWGLSLTDVLRELNKNINNAFNVMYDAATLANTPMFKAVSNPENPFRGLQRFYAGKVWECGSMDEFEQLLIKGADMDVFHIIELLERYSEMASSVIAYTMGRTPTTDPQAPAKKAEIAIQEAGYVIGTMIDEIQESNREMAFQTMELNYQFFKPEMEFMVLGAEQGEPQEKMSRKELLRRVNWKPVGTAESLEKAMLKEVNSEVLDRMRLDPVICGSPEMPKISTIIELYDAYLSSAGGDWKKRKAKILPTEEEIPLMEQVNQLQGALGEAQAMLEEAGYEPNRPGNEAGGREPGTIGSGI